VLIAACASPTPPYRTNPYLRQGGTWVRQGSCMRARPRQLQLPAMRLTTVSSSERHYHQQAAGAAAAGGSPQAVLGDGVPHQSQAGQHTKLAKHSRHLVLAPLQRQPSACGAGVKFQG
jgi:hypothetical protein